MFVFISIHTNCTCYVSYVLTSKSFAFFFLMLYSADKLNTLLKFLTIFVCIECWKIIISGLCVFCNSFRFHFYTVCSEMSLTHCGPDNRNFRVFLRHRRSHCCLVCLYSAKQLESIRLFGGLMLGVIHTSPLKTGQLVRGLGRKENKL